MAIDRADVEKIAELARLELTAEETDLFTQQLGSILKHVQKLNELDTTNVPPMSHCSPAGGDAEYAKRDDQVRPSLGQKIAVENAPDSEAGFFKVPKVVER
jgi:aspartyl-tRNA(Asn)/glutamyl-tRNA(Gln) amidotransferase subunit C